MIMDGDDLGFRICLALVRFSLAIIVIVVIYKL